MYKDRPPVNNVKSRIRIVGLLEKTQQLDWTEILHVGISIEEISYPWRLIMKTLVIGLFTLFTFASVKSQAKVRVTENLLPFLIEEASVSNQTTSIKLEIDGEPQFKCNSSDSIFSSLFYRDRVTSAKLIVENETTGTVKINLYKASLAHVSGDSCFIELMSIGTQEQGGYTLKNFVSRYGHPSSYFPVVVPTQSKTALILGCQNVPICRPLAPVERF